MNILELSVSELIHFGELKDLAKEARKAAELIQTHFSSNFGLGNTKLHVYHTSRFGEYEGNGYISIDGNFYYRDNWWGGREWTFPCTEDGIFKVLRAAYFDSQNNLNALPKEEANYSEVAPEFRAFIQQLEQKNSN